MLHLLTPKASYQSMESILVLILRYVSFCHLYFSYNVLKPTPSTECTLVLFPDPQALFIRFSTLILSLECFQILTIKTVRASSHLIGKILAWHPTLAASLCHSLFDHSRALYEFTSEIIACRLMFASNTN